MNHKFKNTRQQRIRCPNKKRDGGKSCDCGIQSKKSKIMKVPSHLKHLIKVKQKWFWKKINKFNMFSEYKIDL